MGQFRRRPSVDPALVLVVDVLIGIGIQRRDPDVLVVREAERCPPHHQRAAPSTYLDCPPRLGTLAAAGTQRSRVHLFDRLARGFDSW